MLIAIAPTVAATIVVFALLRATTAPTEIGPAFVRIIVVTIAGFTVANVVNRMANRLLPLAALLRLSLVFPDQAPSRFKMAMRASSSRQLARQVESARAHGLSNDQSTAAEQILLLTSAVGEHDRKTRGHSERVRVYARMLGEQMGIEDDELEKLQWGAILHDIGKLAVPAELLNKPAAPTDEEWDIISQHPKAGAALIAPVADFLGPWALAAESHHERFNGTGYPLGLRGESIPLAGRIVAVADAFEVMTATRSYKEPMSAEAARAELTRAAGSHFDPDVVRAFLSLSTGELLRARGPFGWLIGVPVLGPILGVGGRLVSQIQTIPSTIAGTAPASAVTAGALAVATASGGVALPPPELGFAADPAPATIEVPEFGDESDETEGPVDSPIEMIDEFELDDEPLSDAELDEPRDPIVEPPSSSAPSTMLPAPTTTLPTTTEPTTTVPPATAPTTSTTASAAPTTAPAASPPAPVDLGYEVSEGVVVAVTESPADLSPTGPYRDNQTLWAYDEGRTTLDRDLQFGLVSLAAGTTVCSHYFVIAPVDGDEADNDFEITFDDPVLLVAVTDTTLDETDLFSIPGTVFDIDRATTIRQSQNQPGADRARLQNDRLTLDLRTNPGYVDAIRVVTACG